MLKALHVFMSSGDFPWPRQGGAAALAGFKEGPAIFRHFFVRELAHDGAWQHALDEQIGRENHGLAVRGTEPLENP